MPSEPPVVAMVRRFWKTIHGHSDESVKVRLVCQQEMQRKGSIRISQMLAHPQPHWHPMIAPTPIEGFWDSVKVLTPGWELWGVRFEREKIIVDGLCPTCATTRRKQAADG